MRPPAHRTCECGELPREHEEERQGGQLVLGRCKVCGRCEIYRERR